MTWCFSFLTTDSMRIIDFEYLSAQAIESIDEYMKPFKLVREGETISGKAEELIMLINGLTELYVVVIR